MTAKSFFRVTIRLRRWEQTGPDRRSDWALRDIPPHEDTVWAVDARAAAQQALIPLVSELDEWTQTAGYTVAPVTVAEALHGLGAPTLPWELDGS